jgi:hypothetical protein
MIREKLIEEITKSVYEDVLEAMCEKSPEYASYFKTGFSNVQLNHVLLWLSCRDRHKYCHFESTSQGSGLFVDYSSEESFTVEWDLTESSLDEQSGEILEFLYDLR